MRADNFYAPPLVPQKCEKIKTLTTPRYSFLLFLGIFAFSYAIFFSFYGSEGYGRQKQAARMGLEGPSLAAYKSSSLSNS